MARTEFANPPARDAIEFLRGFLRNPAQVGSVVPSSRALEQRLVRTAAIADARTVVELGPGTGGTTAAFLQAMQPTARLLAIELDPVFHEHLRQMLHDPRLFLELGSAEKLAEMLAARRMPARIPSSAWWTKNISPTVVAAPRSARSGSASDSRAWARPPGSAGAA